MKNILTNNSIKVTVAPGTAYISTDPNQSSYANIAVTLQNIAGVDLAVNSIAIALPAALAPSGTLSSITCVAPDAKLWNFGPSMVNTGEFDATLQSGGNATLAAGATWTFTLQMVTLVSTITQPSAAVATSVIFGDGSTSTVPVSICIAPAVASIVSFNAKPSNINPGGSTALNWRCEQIDYCIISPIDTSHRAASGLLEVSPNATTIYTLYAYAEGVILSAQWAISVANPSIITFGGTAGQSGVDYNNNITLVWKCNQFTNSIGITNDTGVPIPPLMTGSNTPQQGSVSVGPVTAKTTFILTAYGTNVQDFVESTAPININDTTTTFNATSNAVIWQQDKVTLSWDVESVSGITLAPPLQGGPSLQNLSGSLDIYPEQDVTYILTVAGFKSNVPVSNQYPIPLTVTPVLINSYTITPPIIHPDVAPNQAQLAWNTQAQLVSLDNGIGAVQLTGTTTINTPPDGTVYTLTVGTLQNPALITQSVAVNSLCGPYNFTAMAPSPIPDLLVEIANSANIANLLPLSVYNVNLTGIQPSGGAQPPANYTGVFGQYDNISGFGLTNQPFQSYEWADPDNQNGSVTILNSITPGYGGPNTFTQFEGGSYEGYSLYGFEIPWPPFVNQQYVYCVQLTGVMLTGATVPVYFQGLFFQYQSTNLLVVPFQGTITFTWTDPNNQSGTVNILGVISLNPSQQALLGQTDIITRLNSNMAMKMLLDDNDTMLITVNPQTVYISTNPDLTSYANIGINVENTGTEALLINSITVTLHPGLAPVNGLSSIIPVTSAPDIWSFGPDQATSGQFDAYTQSGDNVSLAPGASWLFTLQMVTLPGSVTGPTSAIPVAVTLGDSSVYSVSPTVNIAPAVAAITEFKADSPDINPGDASTLKWQCEEIDYCIVSPVDTTQRNPIGSLTVSPPSTTIYTLYAYADGIILSHTAWIQVANPGVITFGGLNDNNSVNYNDMLTLYWDCNLFTKSISMVSTTGVNIPPLNTNGNTPQQGSVTVGPITEPTIFTLTAHGNNPMHFGHLDANITINNVTATLSANPNSGLWIKDKVTFTWDAVSASDASLSPAITNGPSAQNLSGSADYFPGENVTTLPCQLTAAGYVNGNETTVTNSPPLVLEFETVQIIDFSISPPVIIPGNSLNVATLAWNTQAQMVSIDNGVGTVKATDTTTLQAPANGSVYTLSAGTTQNPGLYTQPVTVVNAFGPYTFNSFAVNPDLTFAVAFPVTASELLSYLIGGDSNGYMVSLTGVFATDQPGPYVAAALYNGADPAGFSVLSLPFVDSPPTFQWTDPNNQTGTITITGVPPTNGSLAALFKSNKK